MGGKASRRRDAAEGLLVALKKAEHHIKQGGEPPPRPSPTAGRGGLSRVFDRPCCAGCGCAYDGWTCRRCTYKSAPQRRKEALAHLTISDEAPLLHDRCACELHERERELLLQRIPRAVARRHVVVAAIPVHENERTMLTDVFGEERARAMLLEQTEEETAQKEGQE